MSKRARKKDVDPSLLEAVRSVVNGFFTHADEETSEAAMDAILDVFKSRLHPEQSEELAMPRKRPREYLEMAIEALRKTKEPLKVSVLLKLRFEMGKALGILGEWDDALDCFEGVHSAARDTGDRKLEADALREMGRIERRRERWGEAIERYGRSRRISEEIGYSAGIAGASNCIGAVCFEQGDLDGARKEFEKALDIASSLPDPKLIAQLENNLAAIADVRGDHSAAVSLYGRALLVFKEIGDARGVAEVYHNIGASYAKLKEWKKASDYYEKSLHISREAGDVELVSAVYLRKSELSLELGESSSARAHAEQALEAFMSMGDRLGAAEAHKLLALAADKDDEWELAEGHFSNAVRINGECGCLISLAEACRDFGIACLRKGDSARGNDLLTRSLDIFRKLALDEDELELESWLAKTRDGGVSGTSRT